MSSDANSAKGPDAGDFRGRSVHWEHFSHGSDIGLRASAEDRATVFEAMARAMTAAITDPESIEPVQRIELRCPAAPNDILLVDWLNALVYEMATRKMLFRDFSVTLGDEGLRAVAVGEHVDRGRHQPVVEIKGATYTALCFVHGDDGRWRAQCVVDV